MAFVIDMNIYKQFAINDIGIKKYALTLPSRLDTSRTINSPGGKAPPLFKAGASKPKDYRLLQF